MRNVGNITVSTKVTACPPVGTFARLSRTASRIEIGFCEILHEPVGSKNCPIERHGLDDLFDLSFIGRFLLGVHNLFLKKHNAFNFARTEEKDIYRGCRVLGLRFDQIDGRHALQDLRPARWVLPIELDRTHAGQVKFVAFRPAPRTSIAGWRVRAAAIWRPVLPRTPVTRTVCINALAWRPDSAGNIYSLPRVSGMEFFANRRRWQDRPWK